MSRRGSSMFGPGGPMASGGGGPPMNLGLEDYDSDSDSDHGPPPPQVHKPRAPAGPPPGNPNHRPLVGGFAAAAYEAARADYVAKMKKEGKVPQGARGPPPSHHHHHQRK